MKTMLRTACLLVATVWARYASANCPDLASVAWTDANVDALRTCDKAAVEQFVNELNGPEDIHHMVVGEYRWLRGDRSDYRLVTTLDASGRALFDGLAIYTRSNSGKIRQQSLVGVWISLDKAIRDLDGDGRAEIIVPTPLAHQNARAAFPVAVWPKVYRLHQGRYEEASTKFVTFYETEVFPELDTKISDAKKLDDPYSQQRIAALEMTKDKILRASGQDPDAGLERARAWMRSSEFWVLGNAVVVLGDIGGHQDELRAAEHALQAARDLEPTTR